jgi:hypothetical protein
MSTDQDSQVSRPRTGRDRRHLYPGRSRAVNAKFTDDEYAELAAAAELAGLTRPASAPKPPSTPPAT